MQGIMYFVVIKYKYSPPPPVDPFQFISILLTDYEQQRNRNLSSIIAHFAHHNAGSSHVCVPLLWRGAEFFCGFHNSWTNQWVSCCVIQLQCKHDLEAHAFLTVLTYNNSFEFSRAFFWFQIFIQARDQSQTHRLRLHSMLLFQQTTAQQHQNWQIAVAIIFSLYVFPTYP